MFLHIFTYELRYWLRNPSIYIYGLIAFLFGLLSMAGNAGAFGDASGGTARMANSSIALYNLIELFTKLALFFIPSIVGNSVYRDYKSNAHHILFSYPIEKSGYLLAKFLSSFVVVILIALLFLTGCFSGTLVPNTDVELLVPFQLSIYIELLIVYLLPNLLLFSAISFAIILFVRSIYAGFITVVIIIILREILVRLTTGADANLFALLLDPFGETATQFYTGTWTIKEQNFTAIPIEKFLLLNRFLWLTVSFSVAFLCHYKFSFSHHPVKLTFKKLRTFEKNPHKEGNIIKIKLTGVSPNLSLLGHIKQAWLISLKEYTAITKTAAFISIALAGSLFVFVLLSQMNAPYGVKVLPITWVMLAFPVLFFSLLINFVTFLYAGILVQRSRTYNMMQLVDTTAIPDWIMLMSKFLALVKIQLTLLSIVLLVGIIVQLTNGYFHIEIGHYLFDLFGIHLIGFVIWAFAALLIQTVFANSWLGLFVLILMFFGISELPLLGIENYLFRFNQNPDAGFYLQYSDLSGYSHSLMPYFIYKAYWFCFGLLLFIISLIFWQRGMPELLKNRLLSAFERFRYQLWVPTLCLIILIITTGFWIQSSWSNSSKPLTAKQKEAIYKEADAKYQMLQHLIQPRIVTVNVAMDIYPEQENFRSTGNYTLVNKSGVAIDTLIVNTSSNVLTNFKINTSSSIILSDKKSGITLLKFTRPMKPGDSLTLSYTVNNIPNTLFHKNSLVEKNGTNITSLIYPTIGYRPNNFVSQPEDSAALRNHYRSFDSDYISFTSTVSTSTSQIAVAPGYLTNKWSVNGRNYYQYQSISQVTNDYAFVSGEYEITKSKWNDIEIEIYHHKRHSANIGHMIKGIKATLAYCEANFSKYQHKQIKIIEYSRSLGDFAQSFANTIPYSEIGFIMDIDAKGVRGINLPFLGASHESAHQWWGMQAIPADVNGAKMITESMAEYVSLKVLEKEFGKEKALEYLDKSMNTYLRQSLDDESDEMPLLYNTGNDKAHIPYQKGLLALNAMSRYLGEEKLNNALKKYLSKVYQQSAPYTTSLEMMNYIKKASPDSLKNIIRDLFEDVIIYDNKIADATITLLNSRQFEVELSFDVKKYRKEKTTYSEIPATDDCIEIGFYKPFDGTKNLPTEVKRIRMKKNQNSIRFTIGFKPEKIIIDPYLLIIDKNRKDNVIQL